MDHATFVRCITPAYCHDRSWPELVQELGQAHDIRKTANQWPKRRGLDSVPFSYAQKDRVIADLEAAGLVDVTVETIEFLKPISDLDAFARGIIFGTPIYDEILGRDGINPIMFMTHIKERFESAWGSADPKIPLKATVYFSWA